MKSAPAIKTINALVLNAAINASTAKTGLAEEITSKDNNKVIAHKKIDKYE